MAVTDPGDSSTDARSRSRRTVAAVGVAGLLGAGLGFVGYTAMQSQDSASVTVLINPTLGNPYSPTSDNITNVQSDSAIVTSDEVVGAVVEALGGEYPAEAIAQRVNAAAEPSSQVITISSQGSGNPPNEYLASQFAQAYLDTRQATAEQKLSSLTKILESQIQAAEKELVASSAAASKAQPGSSTELVLLSRVRVASEALASLYNELASTTASSTDPGRILSASSDSSGGALLWWLVAGFLVGASLGYTGLQATRK